MEGSFNKFSRTKASKVLKRLWSDLREERVLYACWKARVVSHASSAIIATTSKIRHWRRCERRREMAFVIGPVAPVMPPAISGAPVCGVCVIDVCDTLLLFTIQAIF